MNDKVTEQEQIQNEKHTVPTDYLDGHEEVWELNVPKEFAATPRKQTCVRTFIVKRHDYFKTFIVVVLSIIAIAHLSDFRKESAKIVNIALNFISMQAKDIQKAFDMQDEIK